MKAFYSIIILFLLSVSFYCCNNKSSSVTRIPKKEYYENGVIKSEYFETNGKKDSVFKGYYPSGKIHVTAGFKNGDQDGVTKVFYENGNVEKITYFRNGINVDTLKIYYENGNLHELSYLVNGQKNGVAKIFYSNGALFEEGHVEDGYKTGCWKTYDSTLKNLNSVSFFDKNNVIYTADTSDYTLKPIALSNQKINISLPIHWNIKYNYQGLLLIAGRPLSKVNRSSSVLLSISEMDTTTSEEDINQFMENNTNGLKKFNNLKKIIENKTITVNRITTVEETVILNANNSDMVSSMYCFKHNNRIFVITCTAPANSFSFFEELFHEIIQTVNCF